jgi:hypothetical protein
MMFKSMLFFQNCVKQQTSNCDLTCRTAKTVSPHPTTKDFPDYSHRRETADGEQTLNGTLNSFFSLPPPSSLSQSSPGGHDYGTCTARLHQLWDRGEQASVSEILESALEMMYRFQAPLSSPPDGRSGLRGKGKHTSRFGPSPQGRE